MQKLNVFLQKLKKLFLLSILILYEMKFTSFLITLILLLSSCSKEEKTVRFSSWQSSPSEERIIRESLDSFEIAHPDVDYKFQPIPGNYTEKIQLMLGTGKAPDLFWLKGDTSPAYMSFEVLQPLDSLAINDSSFNIDDFFPVFKDAFKYKGKYYGFGKDFNAYVLFYNPDMLQEAGFNDPPSNWNELLDYAKKLTLDKNNDGTIDQYGFVVEPSIDMVLPFAYQNEAELIDEKGNIKIGEPAFIEAMEFYMNMYRQGIATIPTDLGAGWNGDVFGRQQAAMVISGAWLIPYLKESFPDVPYKVTQLPMGKKRATLAFCNAYVIPKQTDQLTNSWKMLSYLSGKEGMKIWTSSGIALPTRKSVAIENGFYKDSVFNVFLKSAEYAKLYKVNLQERWYDESQAMMQALFYKSKDPKEVLPKLAKKLERYKLK